MEYEQDEETLSKAREVIGHLELPSAILPQDFQSFKEHVNERFNKIEDMLYNITNLLKTSDRDQQKCKRRRLQFQSTVLQCSSPQSPSPMKTPLRNIYTFEESPVFKPSSPSPKVCSSLARIDTTLDTSTVESDLSSFQSCQKTENESKRSCIVSSAQTPTDTGAPSPTDAGSHTPITKIVADEQISVFQLPQNKPTISETKEMPVTGPCNSVISTSIDISGGSVSVSEIMSALNQSNNQYQFINVPHIQQPQNDVITDMNFWYLTLNQLEGVGLTSDRIKALLRDGSTNIPCEAEMPAVIEQCKSKITGAGGAKEFAKALFGMLFRLGDVFEKNSSGKGSKNRTAFDPKRMAVIREAVQSHYGPQSWTDALTAINKNIAYLFGKNRLGKSEVRLWLQVFPTGKRIPGFD